MKINHDTYLVMFQLIINNKSHLSTNNNKNTNNNNDHSIRTHHHSRTHMVEMVRNAFSAREFILCVTIARPVVVIVAIQ